MTKRWSFPLENVIQRVRSWKTNEELFLMLSTTSEDLLHWSLVDGWWACHYTNTEHRGLAPLSRTSLMAPPVRMFLIPKRCSLYENPLYALMFKVCLNMLIDLSVIGCHVLFASSCVQLEITETNCWYDRKFSTFRVCVSSAATYLVTSSFKNQYLEINLYDKLWRKHIRLLNSCWACDRNLSCQHS